nr:ParA family protein [uncultured Bacteroides sp.]
MKNITIIFSNIKGGVGKTTLCALFASYLAEKGYPVIAIDADLQASLYRHRQREKDVAPDTQIPWNVEMLDSSDSDKLVQVVNKLKSVPGIVLIDCPGNLNDRNLAYIYKSADTAIIPISFDADTVDATGIFVKALKSVSSADLVFVPNRINAAERKSEELRQREQTIGFLGLVGTVTPMVKQSVVVKRYSTLYPLEKSQTELLEPAFSRIIEKLDLSK